MRKKCTLQDNLRLYIELTFGRITRFFYSNGSQTVISRRITLDTKELFFLISFATFQETKGKGVSSKHITDLDSSSYSVLSSNTRIPLDPCFFIPQMSSIFVYPRRYKKLHIQSLRIVGYLQSLLYIHGVLVLTLHQNSIILCVTFNWNYNLRIRPVVYKQETSHSQLDPSTTWQKYLFSPILSFNLLEISRKVFLPDLTQNIQITL